MKQTKNYKLNLVEPSDTFSPDPLNANMETLDTRLAAVGSSSATLDSRLKALEARRFVLGSYTGVNRQGLTVNLGFTPSYVFIAAVGNYSTAGALCAGDSSDEHNRVVDGGFHLDADASGARNPFNLSNGVYVYFAYA